MFRYGGYSCRRRIRSKAKGGCNYSRNPFGVSSKWMATWHESTRTAALDRSPGTPEQPHRSACCMRRCHPQHRVPSMIPHQQRARAASHATAASRQLSKMQGTSWISTGAQMGSYARPPCEFGSFLSRIGSRSKARCFAYWSTPWCCLYPCYIDLLDLQFLSCRNNWHLPALQQQLLGTEKSRAGRRVNYPASNEPRHLVSWLEGCLLVRESVYLLSCVLVVDPSLTAYIQQQHAWYMYVWYAAILEAKVMKQLRLCTDNLQ